MDVDDDKADLLRKEMDVLMGAVNKHYAWLVSDKLPGSVKRRREMQNYIKLPEGAECSNNTGHISVLLGAFFEYNAPVDPELMGQGLVERTYFAPEGTLTATPLHHLYHVTDKGSDHVTLSMSTPKEFRRRITETEEFRTRIPEREYYKMTLCSIEFPTFRYVADFVRMVRPDISLEEILKNSEKKIIKASQNSDFLESAFYWDIDPDPERTLLFITIPYLGWEPLDYGSQQTDLHDPNISIPKSGDKSSNKERESFEYRSQRPPQEPSGGPSTILSPLEKELERLTSYNLTSGEETPWKSTLSLFEYRFPFRPGLDTNSIFTERGMLDSLDMYYKAVSVHSITFILLDKTLISFRAESDQQSGINIPSPTSPYPELNSAIERTMQSQKDELIQIFQDRISYIDLIIHSKFAEHQKKLFDLLASIKIELISITRVVETQIQALNKLQIHFGDNNNSQTQQRVEERKKFKKCFEDFLVEIKNSQNITVELAKIETMRQQQTAAETSIRMTEERISQEAAAAERFRARQEEMHERNMEYTIRAQEFREETTLVFTIVTTIFLPLNFFTSYYGMNTADIRSTASTQDDFWTVCGPISVVVAVIALAIGCRKQIARSAPSRWIKARTPRVLVRTPAIDRSIPL